MFAERPDVQARLAAETVIWMTTVNAAGQPQTSPVWFLARDDHLLVYSLANTPRARNIRTNPKVALSLNSSPGGDDVVIIEAEAEIVVGGVTADGDSDYQAKYGEAIVRDGMTPGSFARDYPIAIHVRPTRLRAW